MIRCSLVVVSIFMSSISSVFGMRSSHNTTVKVDLSSYDIGNRPLYVQLCRNGDWSTQFGIDLYGISGPRNASFRNDQSFTISLFHHGPALIATKSSSSSSGSTFTMKIIIVIIWFWNLFSIYYWWWSYTSRSCSATTTITITTMEVVIALRIPVICAGINN